MLVTKTNFPTLIEELSSAGVYAIDTETTGLSIDHGDRLFSIAVYDGVLAYYFNFQDYPGCDPEVVLPREWIKLFQGAFDNEATTWVMHNAKFDMGMFHAEGLTIEGTVWDTEISARLEDNTHMSYSLKNCGKRIGEDKDDAVMEYIELHKLYQLKPVSGKNEIKKVLQFDQVPLDIVAPYAEQDVRLTYSLYKRHIEAFHAEATLKPKVNSMAVMLQECALTKVCFDMERLGVRVDKDYCQAALDAEGKKIKAAEAEYLQLTDKVLVDSAKELTDAFRAFNIEPQRTAKANASFTDAYLQTLDHPLSTCIQMYRAACKRYEYFNTFLWHSDSASILHANIRQSGTATGRMSMSTPSLQTLPKKETQEYPVRRAIIPREGFFFAFLDFDQMEYRLMLDYAGARGLIAKVKGGLDVHQATADEAGLTRDEAKTTNFAILYGSGVAKLAVNLKRTLAEAKQIKYAVLSAAPEVGDLIAKVIRTAKEREDHSICNWMGRRYRYPDLNFAYKAPNHLIQGGCADIMKKAMVEVAKFLAPHRSKMLLQVHDELVIEVAYGEEHLIPELKSIVENAYTSKLLPLTCGVEYGLKSWFDKQESLDAPSGEQVLQPDQAEA